MIFAPRIPQFLFIVFIGGINTLNLYPDLNRVSSSKDVFPSRYRSAVARIDVYQKYRATPTGGTGIIISKDGYILTCAHLFETSRPIIEIKVVRVDEEGQAIGAAMLARRIKVAKEWSSFMVDRDIALLKISGNDLPTIKLGNSYEAKTGETLISIGFPEHFSEPTQEIIEGVLEASNIKNKESPQPTFKTTLPFLEGYSGGPVFNIRGEVIGIAESVIRKGYMPPQGFVIPINYAYPLLKQIGVRLPEPKRPLSEGLLKIRKGGERTLWQIGADDDSPEEFDVTESKDYRLNFMIGRDKFSSFSGYINNKGREFIRIDFGMHPLVKAASNLEGGEIKGDLVLVIDSAGGYGGDFRLEVGVGKKGSTAHYAGTYTFDVGAGSHLFPRKQEILIKKEWISPGKNTIFLKNENYSFAERRLYLDCLSLKSLK